jgi:flagellar motor component MotA
MNRNTIVGWIALLGIIFLGFLVAVGIAAAIDQPTQVTCTSTATTYSCVTK